MIEVVPARPEMANQISVQPIQQITGKALSSEELEGLIKSGPTFACVDGSVLALLGMYPIWQDRYVGWGVLSPSIGARMRQIHRSVLRALDDLFPVRRLEAYVVAGHEEGERWVRMLGFEYEGKMKCFYNGTDCGLYARIRR